MLEGKVREVKLGYRISYEAIKNAAHPGKVAPDQSRLIVQRLTSFERGNITPWEALGYLTGVGQGLVAHPIVTYRLLTGNS